MFDESQQHACLDRPNEPFCLIPLVKRVETAAAERRTHRTNFLVQWPGLRWRTGRERWERGRGSPQAAC
jgi:hypothetical protein